jgi:hypothetical protein
VGLLWSLSSKEGQLWGCPWDLLWIFICSKSRSALHKVLVGSKSHLPQHVPQPSPKSEEGIFQHLTLKL